MMLKVIVIVLIVAVSVQCGTGEDEAEEKPRHRRRRIAYASPSKRRSSSETSSESKSFGTFGRFPSFDSRSFGRFPSFKENFGKRRPASDFATINGKPPQKSIGDGDKPESVIIGENGVVSVNGTARKDDEKFKAGVANALIYRGEIFINGVSVYKGKPTGENNYSKTSISSSGIDRFKMEIFKNGLVVFNDYKSAPTYASL